MTFEDKGNVAGVSASAFLGVVIPTYNRVDKLLTCLSRFEAQTCKDFEVWVVMDGCTDTTAKELERYRQTASFRLYSIPQPKAGISVARNRAIARMQTAVCVLSGDDMFPMPEWVELHSRFHREHPGLEQAAISHARWCETGQTVTPFMRWLDTEGTQFRYGELMRGVTPGWNHFYGSGSSAKTALLQRNLYDERFTSYGLEDMELGYRLHRQGLLQLTYLPNAVAEHLHPATFSQSCRRSLNVGNAAYLLGQIWPEHRYTKATTRTRQVLLPLLMRPCVLEPLRWLTAGLNRVWCPNPVMVAILMLFERYGYAQAASRVKAQSSEATGDTLATD